jgi:DNA-binding Lrp family transcriptional regulator
MTLAFVLIKTDGTDARKIYEGLLHVEGVQEIFPLFGEYDFIVKLEAADYDAMGRIVFEGLRTVKGVARTQTLTTTKM